MRLEIKKHWNKLKQISKLTEEQLEESYLQLLNKIQFINIKIQYFLILSTYVNNLLGSNLKKIQLQQQQNQNTDLVTQKLKLCPIRSKKEII